jgi:hypothetical protein
MNKLLTIALSLLAFSACSKGEKTYESPQGYDFSKPQTYKMPEDLAEISGIAFYPGQKDRVYAIQDEEGKLFYWTNGNPESAQHISFGKHGDYEDLGITNNFAIILRSDGILFNFPIQEVSEGTLKSVKEWKSLIPEGEYEGLYVDNVSNDLYVLCKSCGADKKTGMVSGYILHLDNQGVPALTGDFKINTQEIPGFKAKGGLKPSALTYNKQTNEWYLLSSVQKMLIIADKTWKPKQVVHLNPSLFPQPEGIAFDIDNNLYISNEAGNTAAGTVLKFAYKKPAK